ncbi:MAG TPA: M48 family metallopeptidase [Thermoanaerobaculia bacterium]|jgi:heat shock protein HtpX|nr:M48 family metallopeptidase [Thermoanaerobaculia bacterium]
MPLNIYDQQKKNLANTRLFIVGFVALLAVLGMGADGLLYAGGFSPGLPLATLGALAVGGFSAWWALREGDKAVLESTAAVPLDPTDPRQRVLENVVEEMAIAAGMPKPAIYVVPDPDPNAFATGAGPERSSIAVTRGLLERLDRDELQAVVAHEMSHVRNYDVRLMTVVAALAGAVLLLADWSRRGLWWGGRRRNSDGKGGVFFFAVWFLAVLLAPFIARIVSLAVSRQREYLADASGAELTRHPLALASALEKIAAAVEPTRSIKQGIAHLCIEDPRGGTDAQRQGWFAGLWSTHPPIARRIALLKEMAYRASGT